MPKGRCFSCDKTGSVKFLPTSVKGKVEHKPYCKECGAILTIVAVAFHKAKAGDKTAQEFLKLMGIKEGDLNA
jgi:hypothetical protein